MNVVFSFIASEFTEAQLLIAGLVSGGGVIGLVVKWLVSSPEREAAAYKQGVLDEQARSQEDVRILRAHAIDQAHEITLLRNGLLRLAIASDLTLAQRSEIAQALGYTSMSKAMSDTPVEPIKSE
jgi:hypothetical protein